MVQVIPQDSAQVIFTDDDQMIDTLSANRADDAFGVWILEGGSRRGDHFFNLHSLYSQSKFCPVNLISIPEQIARRRVFWEGFDELPGRPFSRGMRCNIEVDDLATVMQQDYETVQVAEGQCRNGKEVDGGNLLCMIGEKCLPSLPRRCAAPDPILRHGRFRKVETEKAKFRLDPRRSSKRVFERHPSSQNLEDDAGLDIRFESSTFCHLWSPLSGLYAVDRKLSSFWGPLQCNTCLRIWTERAQDTADHNKSFQIKIDKN
jgi:hypothetical protein